jgi:uncharacterized phiE125 gp8 family phage protein
MALSRIINYVQLAETEVSLISLETLQDYLKVGTSENELLSLFLRGAISRCERYCGRIFLNKQFSGVITGPFERIKLPNSPLISVDAIYYRDQAFEETLWDSSNYFVETYKDPGEIFPRATAVFPVLAAQNNLRVVWTAGYGETATAVPGDLIDAVLQTVGYMYENRQSQKIPDGAKILLDLYRHLEV